MFLLGRQKMFKLPNDAKIVEVSEKNVNAPYKTDPKSIRPEVVNAKVYQVKSAFIKNSVFVTLSFIEHDEQIRPIEIFINSKDLTRAPEYVVLTRLISAIFRRSPNPMFILEELQGIFDPNGGSFMAYPKLIKLLMDEKFRHEEMKRVNQKALLKCSLPELKREYTLNEIAIITRAGPAKALGLETKGHLGIGADADITIYDVMDDKEMMFSAPRYVIKSGLTMIDNHEFKTDSTGKVYHITPQYDNKIEEVIKPFFEDYYSIEFANYAVTDHYLHKHEIIKTN